MLPPLLGVRTTMRDDTENESTDTDRRVPGPADAIIRSMVRVASEPPEKVGPLSTTDVETVLKAQLTENTGRHLLDSGVYGRHFEENRENDPADKPRWLVRGGYVAENLYHRLANLKRDETAVALEHALYGYGLEGPGEDDSWLTCMKAFVEGVLNREIRRRDLNDWDVNPVAIDRLTGPGQLDPIQVTAETEGPCTVNTYESEFADATQVVQFTTLGGMRAKYGLLQVHGGADVRGGYTAPRVYAGGYDGFMYHAHKTEFQFRCDRCDREAAESVAFSEDFPTYRPEHDDPTRDMSGSLRCSDCGGYVGVM